MQNIICNSALISRVINEDYRYVLWQKKHNSYLAILDITDSYLIANSNCLFVRKLDPDISNELLAEINNNIAK